MASLSQVIESMTRRYQKHHAAMDPAHAEAIEREMLADAGFHGKVKSNPKLRTDRDRVGGPG